MGLMKLAFGDVLITSLWVFILPFVGVTISVTSSFFSVQPATLPALLITITVVMAVVLLFAVLAAAMGGANFNPSTSTSLFVAGLKPSETLTHLVIRLPAQAAGGAAGVMGVRLMMPTTYTHMHRGPTLKTVVSTGALIEGLCSFAFCLVLLLVLTNGPRLLVLKVLILSVSTVALVTAGKDFTGPSLNPANAYGWAYANNWHNSWQLLIVYWIAPLIGAALAACAYRLFVMPSQQKQKKA